jgi:hypothetical protein
MKFINIGIELNNKGAKLMCKVNYNEISKIYLGLN